MSFQREDDPLIFVADDDTSVRAVLEMEFALAGFAVAGFADGEAMLSALRGCEPACIIVDVFMPGRSGLALVKALSAAHCRSPVFVMSGRANIPMAVEAIRSGAFDFIEKPFEPRAVVERVRTAVATAAKRLLGGSSLPDFPGRELLTPREREVLAQITGGASNKEAGRRLGISPRTIEVHRARIMDKLGARNTADLVRMVLGADRRAV
jgi:FixJ family two-component response regulator